MGGGYRGPEEAPCNQNWPGEQPTRAWEASGIQESPTLIVPPGDRGPEKGGHLPKASHRVVAELGLELAPSLHT